MMALPRFGALGALIVGCLAFIGPEAFAEEAPSAEERLLKEAKIGISDAELKAFLNKCAEHDIKARRAPSLIRQLGAKEFAAREKATAELVELGPTVAGLLYKALAADDAEIARRSQECLKKIAPYFPFDVAKEITKDDVKGYRQSAEGVKYLSKRPLVCRPDVRVAALRVALLREMVDEAVRCLVHGLQSPDPFIHYKFEETIRDVVVFSKNPDLSPKRQVWTRDFLVLRSKVKVVIGELLNASLKAKDDDLTAACATVGRMDGAEITQRLEAIQHAKSVQDRVEAIRALRPSDSGNLMARKVAPVLIACLKDKDAKVRQAAAELMGSMLVEADLVLPALHDAIDDEEDKVSFYATVAIGDLGPSAEAAVPVLLGKLNRADSPRRRTAAASLGKIRSSDPRVIPALMVSLKGKHSCGGAAWAAFEMGLMAKEMIPGLIELAKNPAATAPHDPEWERGLALLALGSMGAEAKEAIPVLIDLADRGKDGSRVHNAIDVLGLIGPKAESAIPVLLKRAKDQDYRPSAIQALGRIGPKAEIAVPLLVAIVEDRNIKRSDRIRAVEALQSISPKVGARMHKVLEAEMPRAPQGA